MNQISIKVVLHSTPLNSSSSLIPIISLFLSLSSP